jgi:dihydrofolate synthase / folylpolyglutamate synthase
MQFIPVQTKVMLPPQDSLEPVLTDLTQLQEGDVVLISSKVVAIDEGRCVSMEGQEKLALIKREADYQIPNPHRNIPLTIKYNSFLGSSGIDESNGNGYYVLLPEDAFASVERIHTLLTETHGIKNLGVIITDSRSLPLRYGAMGVALSWWGIAPLRSHIGEPDLFGREFRYERSNIVDGIAAAANLVGGETDECTPVVIARDVPDLTFVEGNTKDKLFSPLASDAFRTLYEGLL